MRSKEEIVELADKQIADYKEKNPDKFKRCVLVVGHVALGSTLAQRISEMESDGVVIVPISPEEMKALEPAEPVLKITARDLLLSQCEPISFKEVLKKESFDLKNQQKKQNQYFNKHSAKNFKKR